MENGSCSRLCMWCGEKEGQRDGINVEVIGRGSAPGLPHPYFRRAKHNPDPRLVDRADFDVDQAGAQAPSYARTARTVRLHSGGFFGPGGRASKTRPSTRLAWREVPPTRAQSPVA